MKKIHILLLVCIAGTIALLIGLLSTGGSTYETIAEAKQKSGKFVHVAVKLDKKQPVDYNPVKDPNFLSFHAMGMEDSTQQMQVIYRRGEIPNLMISERLVLKGKYENGIFECKDVQTKCPSKYKEEIKAPQSAGTGQSNPTAAMNTAASTNSAVTQ